MAKGRGSGPAQGELERSFKSGAFRPLYLFYGEEDFLIDQVVDSLVDAALDESARGFNLDIVDGAVSDGNDVLALASSYPMMGERRLVIVRNFDRLADRDRILPLLERPVPTTILVLIAPKADFRLKVFKLLDEHAALAEFRRLYDEELPAWISERISGGGKAATPEACQLIQAYVGRSLREVQNEIDKLFIYVGEKKTIDADDVNAIVGMSRQFNIFELQKTIGARQLGPSVEILIRMLEAGESPLGMIVMLTRYFKTLWRLQDSRARPGQGWGSRDISPARFREYEEASRRYTASEVEGCFRALLEADESLKLSGTPKVVMIVLLNRLIRQQARAE